MINNGCIIKRILYISLQKSNIIEDLPSRNLVEYNLITSRNLSITY